MDWENDVIVYAGLVTIFLTLKIMETLIGRNVKNVSCMYVSMTREENAGGAKEYF